MYRFNVFGTLMSVRRQGEHWLVFKESDSGIRTRVYDLVLPDDISVEAISGYLDDMYHEHATSCHPSVKRID